MVVVVKLKRNKTNMSKYITHQYYAPLISQKPWYKPVSMHELRHEDSIGVFRHSIQRHTDLVIVRKGMADYLRWFKNRMKQKETKLT